MEQAVTFAPSLRKSLFTDPSGRSVMILTSTTEVTISNLGRDTDCLEDFCGFPQFSHESGKTLQQNTPKSVQSTYLIINRQVK